MQQDDELENFLDMLYAAPAHPSLWSDVLERLVDMTGADSGWMARLVDEGPGGVGITSRLDVAAQSDYFSHFERLDPFRDRRGHRLGVFTDEDYLPRAVLEASEFFNDFMKPLGASSILKLRLSSDGATSTVIHLNRGRARGAFTPDLLGRAGALHAHLARASRLGFAVGGETPEQIGIEAALSANDEPTILLDRSGRVCAVNDAAGPMLRGRRPFSVEGGYLIASNAGLNLKLDRVLTDTDPRTSACAPSGTIVVVSRDGRLPLLVDYKPFGRKGVRQLPDMPSLVVTIRDLNRIDRPPAELLERVFGLTPAEARFARAVVEGKPLAAIAQSAGISVNTAKNHLKSIFAKTGASRQSALVSLLMRVGATR